ncbi:MAG: MFS transporter [Thermomicrobiales bacterium]|nr:MFS transporter [Thermomicrobiales bacterium]
MPGRCLQTDATGQPAAEPISWKRNLYALWIAQTLVLTAFSFRDAFLPFYMEKLGDLSTNQAALWAGIFMSGGSLVMVVAAPFWGTLADRRGRKPMVLRSMWAAMITAFLMAFAVSPWQMVALRMVEGAFTGTVAACAALVASTAPKERMGYALGMIQTAVFVGASIGPFVGGLLADAVGYRATFIASAALFAAGGVIVFAFVRENFVPVERGPERGLAALTSARVWLLTPTLLAMTFILVLTRFTQMGGRPIIPLYVEELGTYTDARAASLAGLSFGLMGLTSAVSALLLGRRGDRVGHQRILVACLIGSVVFYIPMAAVMSAWQVILLQGLFGFAVGGLMPAANAIIVASTPPERRGAIFGFTASVGSLGAFAGPLVGAALAATFGFRVAFAFLSLILLVAVVVILWFYLRGRLEQTRSGVASPGS